MTDTPRHWTEEVLTSGTNDAQAIAAAAAAEKAAQKVGLGFQQQAASYPQQAFQYAHNQGGAPGGRSMNALGGGVLGAPMYAGHSPAPQAPMAPMQHHMHPMPPQPHMQHQQQHMAAMVAWQQEQARQAAWAQYYRDQAELKGKQDHAAQANAFAVRQTQLAQSARPPVLAHSVSGGIGSSAAFVPSTGKSAAATTTNAPANPKSAAAAASSMSWAAKFKLAQQKSKTTESSLDFSSNATTVATSTPATAAAATAATATAGRSSARGVDNRPAWMKEKNESEAAGPGGDGAELLGAKSRKVSRWGQQHQLHTAPTARDPNAPGAATAATASAHASHPTASSSSTSLKPMSLTVWTEQCMSSCKNAVVLEHMRKLLHGKITEAIATGTVSRDWSTVPAPILPEHVAKLNVDLNEVPQTMGVTQYQNQRQHQQPYDASGHYGGGGGGGSEKGKGKKGNSKKRRFNKYLEGQEASNEENGQYERLYRKAGADSAEQQQRSTRLNRFKYSSKDQTSWRLTTGAEEAAVIFNAKFDLNFDPESLKVVGTCPALEKHYFRLTSAPNPETVRPVAVLRRSLAHLQSKWQKSMVAAGGGDAHGKAADGGGGGDGRSEIEEEEEEASEAVSYEWICDQLKAVRQDLTVQHIFNGLTIDVYEFHAKCALECGDLNEYNQCQTQLRELYRDPQLVGEGRVHEFTAYRLLYYLYLQGNKKYDEGNADLLAIRREIREHGKFMQKAIAARAPTSSDVKGDVGNNTLEDSEPVQHALKVMAALGSNNYAAFFRLHRWTPNDGNKILDLLETKLRVAALRIMVKAYKPSPLSIAFVKGQLFREDESEKFAADFCKVLGLVLVGDGDSAVDTKKSAGKALSIENVETWLGVARGSLL